MLHVDSHALLLEAWSLVEAEEKTAELALLAGAILEKTHPKQRGFVEDPSVRIAITCPRGTGKSAGVIFRLVRAMLLRPAARCVYVALSQTTARDILWAPLHVIIAKLNIPARFYEDDLRITFLHNGSQLKLLGADDRASVERLRGQPFDEVDIDECASFAPPLMDYLVNQVIIPRIGERGGALCLVGTPKPVFSGPFYEVTRPGSSLSRPYDQRDDFEGWDNWSFHHWEYEDCAMVPEIRANHLSALAEKKRNGWSDEHPIWQREYLARWFKDDTETIFKYRPFLDDGKPWNQWNPERDETTGFAKLPTGFDDWIYCYGLDVGVSDPLAIEIFAYSPSDGTKTLYHVFEFQKRRMHNREIAVTLVGEDLDVVNPAGLIGVTGWPDSFVGDVAGSGKMLFLDLAETYGITIDPAPRTGGDKRDSIEIFNGDLVDGRIKILRGSQLETQLASLQWVTDEKGIVKEEKGKRNDAADAAVYARVGAKHLLSETPDAPPPRGPVRDPAQPGFNRPTPNPFFGNDDDDICTDLDI